MSCHNKPIDLKLFPGRLNNSRFVVMYSRNIHEDENVFCLTPHVMQWSEHIYLLDLHSCINYWHRQAQSRDIDLLALYEKILLSVAGDDCIAVCCAHPWQGVLFLYYLIDNKSPGIHTLNSLFNKKAYEKLPWQYWFMALADLGRHLEAIKARRFSPAGFRSKIAQMQRFVQSIDLPGLGALNQAETGSIKRRYSGWMGEAWEWTWAALDNEKSGYQRSGSSHFLQSSFPWRPLKYRQSIRVKRHLDYAVSLWDVIEPLLREDFTKLCALKCWSSQDKINRLYWRINLFNLQQVTVEISFRHPCSLHKQSPAFKTALYQAYYAYMDMMQALTTRDSDLDLPEEMPFIGWQLEIEHILHMPQFVLDMFEKDRADAGYERILDLQNCLPEAMEHYAIKPDFVPDQLFEEIQPGDVRDYDFSLKQWSDIELARPLFYYARPLVLEKTATESVKFLERTACNWWQSENSEDLARDYFILKNTRGQYLWVYRNSAGRWYQHGIYC